MDYHVDNCPIKGCIITMGDNIWYEACPLCFEEIENSKEKKNNCQKCMSDLSSTMLRYLLSVYVQDFTGSVWLMMYNDEVKQLIGCLASELLKAKNQLLYGVDMEMRRSILERCGLRRPPL